MILINKIPWKALLIFLAGITIGLYLGGKGAVNTIVRVFETESVSEALNKPTQQTTTNNRVDLKKLKVKKSDSVVFKFEPITTQTPVQIITNDSCNYYYELIKALRPGQLKRLKEKTSK